MVGVIHALESSLNFGRHLHNGDPLTARTVQVPAGRPKTGQPPFTWEASASDALRFQGFDKWKDWSIPGTLFKLEGYNGFGYRDHHPDVPSPYLWSFSNHYSRGKYVADGTFSPTAVSAQCGVAVLLRRMAEKKLIVFGDVPKAKGPILRFAPKVISEEGKQLQHFLNGFPGIVLREDGQLGEGTSDALSSSPAGSSRAIRARSSATTVSPRVAPRRLRPTPTQWGWALRQPCSPETDV